MLAQDQYYRTTVQIGRCSFLVHMVCNNLSTIIIEVSQYKIVNVYIGCKSIYLGAITYKCHKM